ncbi:MAG TPA: hypothetical protein DCR61_03125 [Verrucomicrobiales bacterium]|nr:hypothetical protein [Verrucomicrobiales bacterium]HCP38557.1 hypothetical protein [Verrucomicrobiales bacterium]
MNKRLFDSNDCANALKNLWRWSVFLGPSFFLKKSMIFDYIHCLSGPPGLKRCFLAVQSFQELATSRK